MIPTMLGRWQTRLLLFVLLGLPITLLYSIWLSGFSWPPAWEPFYFLGTLLAIGLVLDVVYFQMQRFRWDHDFPFAFFVFFSIVEFLITFALMRLDLLPYLPACSLQRQDPATRQLVCQVYTVPFWVAAWHFTLVFVPILLAVLGGVQIFLVRWRYKGGELGRFPITE